MQLLTAALRDRNAAVRRMAAQSLANHLGRLVDTRVLTSLVAALRDPRSSVRRWAANALNQVGWEPESDIDRSWEVVATQDWGAFIAMHRVGFHSLLPLEPLVTVLGDSSVALRRQAAEVLVAIGLSSAPLLVVALRDDNAAVRRQAAEVLGQLGDTRAVEPLVAVMRDDSNYNVRRRAVEALRRIGSPEALAALQEREADKAKKR